MYEKSRRDQWEIFLEVAGNISNNTPEPRQSHEPSGSAPRPSVASVATNTSSNLKSISRDPFVEVSQIMDLLQNEGTLPITRQIEISFRLQLSLSRFRSLVEPLQTLFHLILMKASNVPVYVFMAIGDFYSRLKKRQEALEVYSVASQKIDHLDIPLKFVVYTNIGHCYYQRGTYVESLKFYETAYVGRKNILSERHCRTIESLVNMIDANIALRQHSELLRLYDKIFPGQDLVPEVPLVTTLYIQCFRRESYAKERDPYKKWHMADCMQITLKRCLEIYSEVALDMAYFAVSIGHAHRHRSIAVDCYRVSAQVYRQKGRVRDSLKCQYWIARQFLKLGQFSDAKQLLKEIYAEQQEFLPSNHEDTRATNFLLRKVSFILDTCHFENPPRLSRTCSNCDLQLISFSSNNASINLNIRQHRYPAEI